MEQFFKFVDRVNALAFFAGVVLAACLVIWMLASSYLEKKPITTVVAPQANEEKPQVLTLVAWDYIPELSIQLLKLQAQRNGASEYGEGRRQTNTRNLLFVGNPHEGAKWLFPNQSQSLGRFERLTASDGSTKAIAFQAWPEAQKEVDEFSLYLVSPDGERLVEVLKNVTQILSQRKSGDVLRIIYQTGKEIREAKLRLSSFDVMSNKRVLTVVPSS